MPREQTDAELDALIVALDAEITEYRDTMPSGDASGDAKCAPASRGSMATRAAIESLLAVRGRLTARQIAASLGASTRAVQISVCNAIKYPKKCSRLRREKPVGSEYVYFLGR